MSHNASIQSSCAGRDGVSCAEPSVGRQRLFHKPADYATFEALIEETLDKSPLRICNYCLLPNHWHFLLWPENDGDLADFMQRLTVTHVTRWQKHHKCVGQGHVYLGRFKSFPVQADAHFYQVTRYWPALVEMCQK